jgi:hypothetical protein
MGCRGWFSKRPKWKEKLDLHNQPTCRSCFVCKSITTSLPKLIYLYDYTVYPIWWRSRDIIQFFLVIISRLISSKIKIYYGKIGKEMQKKKKQKLVRQLTYTKLPANLVYGDA